MKLTILITSISLLLISCSSENDENINEQNNKNSINSEYVVSTDSPINNFIIDNNNNLILFYSPDTNNFVTKINSKGNEMISPKNIKIFFPAMNNNFFSENIGVALSNSNEILFSNTDFDGGKQLITLDSNLDILESYTVKDHISNAAGPIFEKGINTFENFGDNTYIFFDFNSVGLRRYFPNLETDLLIAGNQTSSIVDDEGRNASFKFVSDIEVLNQEIYVVDNNKTLRKLVKKSESQFFEVTTIINDNENDINDLFVYNNSIYLVINNQGIFKLTNNNINLVNNDSFDITTDVLYNPNSNEASSGLSTGINLKSIQKIEIHNNDMYIQDFRSIIKVNDFKDKISL